MDLINVMSWMNNSRLQRTAVFYFPGNVVANRLTEISNCTVLLLEAGGPESTISDVPLMNYNLWFTDFDWNYTTVPQQNACQSMYLIR